MNLDDLKKPFPPEAVHWRVGATTGDKSRGMALAYIDARDVMDRLDEACGPDGWQSRFEAVAGRVVCSIGIKCDWAVLPDSPTDRTRGEWAWKSDGAGDTDVEGEKGGLSDAFKRAAVHWGIGRYLYRLDSPWVAIEKAGNSYKIKDGERGRLLAVLGSSQRPASARGDNSAGVQRPAPQPSGEHAQREPAATTAAGPGVPKQSVLAARASEAMLDARDLDALETTWSRMLTRKDMQSRTLERLERIYAEAKANFVGPAPREVEGVTYDPLPADDPLDDTDEAVADLEGRDEDPRQT